MSDEEKVAAFNRIQESLWGIVLGSIDANMLQQTIAAQYIRGFKIPGPNGENPESA